MGETNPRFTEGWKAFERGEALHLGLDTDTVFADGWLEAAQCALVACSWARPEISEERA